ncbi:MAG: right-handed parallel beta-helix repeat-containing protein [Candidatus Electrothrix sp. AUS4]|nr:right-handed parallel beta-helix repeat-containing protein [Candidatus Electrothrix sp. AUS4]
MKKQLIQLFFLFLLTITPQTILSTTLSVPSQYATVSAAAAVANDGDEILIEAGEYTGSGIIATWNQNDLTIRGINGQAHLNASGLFIPNGKAIWVIGGNNILVENIEFSHADVPDNNGAGIRYQGTGSLTVRKCYFHHNEMGILTGNLGTEEITIESSEFHDHGKSNNGFSHNIYIGQGAKFTFINSYSHDAYQGHNVKSRADENHILYNRIVDFNDSLSPLGSSYLIDLPEGGLSYIIGNELHQSTKTENTTAISYAKENRNGPLQTLYMNNNTIVNDRSNGIALNVGGNPDGQIVNNIFDNFPTLVVGNFLGAFSNNEEDVTFVDRENMNYRLTNESNGRNTGIDPGFGNGVDLTPLYEYLHPLQGVARYSDGQLDMGALEVRTGAAMVLPPILFLLL